MDILYILIPVAILLLAFATWAFFWSLDSGQYDDLESPAHRILYDDDEAMIPPDARIKTPVSGSQASSDTGSTEAKKVTHNDRDDP